MFEFWKRGAERLLDESLCVAFRSKWFRGSIRHANVYEQLPSRGGKRGKLCAARVRADFRLRRRPAIVPVRRYPLNRTRKSLLRIFQSGACPSVKFSSSTKSDNRGGPKSISNNEFNSRQNRAAGRAYFSKISWRYSPGKTGRCGFKSKVRENRDTLSPSASLAGCARG